MNELNGEIQTDYDCVIGLGLRCNAHRYDIVGSDDSGQGTTTETDDMMGTK